MFKMGKSHIFIQFLLISSIVGIAYTATHTEDELIAYLKDGYEKAASNMCTKSVNASWAYETDLTKEHSENVTNTTIEAAKFDKDTYEEWFKSINIEDIKDPETKRMLKSLKEIGSAVLDPMDLRNLSDTNSQMVNIYSTGKICPYKEQKCSIEKSGLNLEPEIEKIVSTSTDYDELLYVWRAWRDATGKKIRSLYPTYVELSNKVSVGNNFTDFGAYWRDSFDTPNFVEDLDKIWKQVRPLYKQLHSHAKKKLLQRYPTKISASNPLLPAHVFGNMWAQSWGNLEKLLKPFPNESQLDLTKALKDQNYSVRKLFETSNNFYTSLGLPTNEVSYGPEAMIERPEGKEVLCHASAWDFCDKERYLIKMCTEVNEEDFITVHHEMGHIQYYIQYKDQPIKFREGANPGFHEAVGDTMALSVQSIKHLKAIKLLSEDFNETKEADINTLMSMALDKVAFLPFGLLIDKWRWDVFAKTVPESEWNKHWWELREKYQLIYAPGAKRTEEDFDPGAKFHVAGDSQYISYFVSHILQFQFYKGLCIAAGEYNPKTKSPPLHKCDFYNNKEAGELIKKALSLGSSKPWPEVLKIIAGTDKLDASALLEYFEPLSKYFDDNANSAGNSHIAFSPWLLGMLCAFFIIKM